MADLGDLTWNKEKELMCPVNRIGKIDVFVVSHHGLNASNSPALVHAIAPRIAIMDNGAKKGGSPFGCGCDQVIARAGGALAASFRRAGGKEHNTSDSYIANIEDADTGYYLELTAHEDGSFEMYNPRNKFSRTYSAK